jgi:hypothetical protein
MENDPLGQLGVFVEYTSNSTRNGVPDVLTHPW